MLNEALNYLKSGLSVIPLRSKSKEPLIKWQEFQKRHASESEVKEWFKKWPDANLGIVTGSVSRVSIVDLDGLEGVKEATRLSLTSCLVTITGKGKHLWFRVNDTLIANSVRSYPGIDIRGEGGYVLAPPSVHPNGTRYRFNRPFASCVGNLPLFPTSLFASDAPLTSGASAPGVVKEESWIAKDLEAMTNGNIDNTLFRVCSRLRNDGYSSTDAYILLNPHAERAGAAEGHLQAKIDNVWGRYEPKHSRSQLQNGANGGALQLHSPTNPDSLNEYAKRVSTTGFGTVCGTGYPQFDTLTKGLKKGEVLTIAARTGVGKTNWIITPIREFCTAGKSVLLFSTEMSFDQIWGRYCATLTRATDFKKQRFFICDEFTPNIERIEEAIKNVNPDLFVFDHISHIGTDYHIISKFMSEIKRLARLYDIPAIVTAQLNRHADYVEQGAKIEPRLSMIQGSDQIGQMSAQVLLLNEKRVSGDVTEIEGLIVKNRHGDKGMVQFGLLKNPYRMEEI